MAATIPSIPDQTGRVIAFVVYPGLTLLDLVGPLQVLRGLPAPYRTLTVGERLETVDTDTGLQIRPEATFADLPQPFAVIVPGGGLPTIRAMGNTAIRDYLQHAAQTAEVIGSVCTGALILGAAGLLEGRPATTHWAFASYLERLGARFVRQRWVEDGPIITAAGVSAGIDMGLALAARLTDAATARRIQNGIEYDPHPPQGGMDYHEVDTFLAQAIADEAGLAQRHTLMREALAERPDLQVRLGLT